MLSLLSLFRLALVVATLVNCFFFACSCCIQQALRTGKQRCPLCMEPCTRRQLSDECGHLKGLISTVQALKAAVIAFVPVLWNPVLVCVSACGVLAARNISLKLLLLLSSLLLSSSSSSLLLPLRHLQEDRTHRRRRAKGRIVSKANGSLRHSEKLIDFTLAWTHQCYTGIQWQTTTKENKATTSVVSKRLRNQHTFTFTWSLITT